MQDEPVLNAEAARCVAAEAVARGHAALEQYATAQGTFQEWRKEDGSLVTAADLASDDEIAACIRRLAPGTSILSEERTEAIPGQQASWLVDPLCGTAPFAQGLVNWGVSVAFQEDGRLVAGAFATSMTKTPWSGGAGMGVRVGEEVAPAYSGPSELGTSIVCIENSPGGTFPDHVNTYRDVLRRAEHVHTYGSAVFPGAQVCMGRMGAVLFPEADLVHVAGVAAVAEGVGLMVSDAQGRGIDWSAGHASLVLIAPPRIHAQVLDAINHG
ncbi:MAG: hypothetical protein OXE02_01990 [Chloroflexi bacterium]|nr:hypothetical protein [Chloroflexota bacterium]